MKQLKKWDEGIFMDIWRKWGKMNITLISKSEIEERLLKLIKLNPTLGIWGKYDYLFFYVAIPTVLVSVYLLPQHVKDNYFILHISNPTLLSIFLSNYTHITLPHLLDNLFDYSVIIFLLFNLETNKKRFYVVSALLFILLPFISLFSNYLPPMSIVETSYGFSAIVSGFIGYLLYVIYGYLKNVCGLPLRDLFITMVLFINFTLIAAFGQVSSSLTFGLLTISIILIYINRESIKEISKQAHIKLKDQATYRSLDGLYKLFVFILAFLYLFSLPALIPTEIRIGNNQINVYAHYLGYSFGMVAPSFVETLTQNTKIPRLSWRILK